jgi:hypothetical protein
MLLFLDVKLRSQLNQNANQVGWVRCGSPHWIFVFLFSKGDEIRIFKLYIYIYGGNEQWTLKLMDSCNGIIVEVYLYMGQCIGTLNLYTKCIYSMSFLPLVCTCSCLGLGRVGLVSQDNNIAHFSSKLNTQFLFIYGKTRRKFLNALIVKLLPLKTKLLP